MASTGHTCDACEFEIKDYDSAHHSISVRVWRGWNAYNYTYGDTVDLCTSCHDKLKDAIRGVTNKLARPA